MHDIFLRGSILACTCITPMYLLVWKAFIEEGGGGMLTKPERASSPHCHCKTNELLFVDCCEKPAINATKTSYIAIRENIFLTSSTPRRSLAGKHVYRATLI